MKKYEFTGETKEFSGRTLHRIVALIDIRTNMGIVKKGDKGGWLEKESNLSHYGNCWVFNEAKVYDNALISGHAVICDNATVCGEALVYNDAEISGNAVFRGHSEICGNTKISGDDTENKDRIVDNYTHFKKEIDEIIRDGDNIALVNGKLAHCNCIDCQDCDFDKDNNCKESRYNWLNKAYEESTESPNINIQLESHILAVRMFFNDYKKLVKQLMDQMWIGEDGNLCYLGNIPELSDKMASAHKLHLMAVKELNEFREKHGLLNNTKGDEQNGCQSTLRNH